MTKKDYIILATALLDTRPDKNAAGYIQWLLDLNTIANALQQGNPRFNREKFTAAAKRGE